MRELFVGVIANGETYLVAWFYPDFHLALEVVVEWYREESITQEQALYVLGRMKMLNDAEIDRYFETTDAGRIGPTQSQFAPRRGGNL